MKGDSYVRRTSLPPRPNLEHYKKLAKDLQDAASQETAMPPRLGRELDRDTVKLYDLDITLPRDGHRETPAEIQLPESNARDGSKASRSRNEPSRPAAPWPSAQFFLARATASRAGRSSPITWKRLRSVNSPVSALKRQWTPSSAATCRHSRKLLQGESQAGARPLDTRTSLHVAPLCLGERRRGLPSEDAKEHCRDHEAAA